MLKIYWAYIVYIFWFCAEIRVEPNSYSRNGKSVLYDQPTHVGHESVDCWPTNSWHIINGASSSERVITLALTTHHWCRKRSASNQPTVHWKQYYLHSPYSKNEASNNKMPVFCRESSQQSHGTPQKETECQDVFPVEDTSKQSHRNSTECVDKDKDRSCQDLILFSRAIIIPSAYPLAGVSSCLC